MGKALEGDVSAAKYVLSHKHPDYMTQKKTGENSVHIYHHVDKKPDNRTVTFDDIMDNLELFRIWMEESKNHPDKRNDKF